MENILRKVVVAEEDALPGLKLPGLKLSGLKLPGLKLPGLKLSGLKMDGGPHFSRVTTGGSI